ncbi:hypothetical protein ABZ208_12675 [Streptomyces sp. NPDC006208]|uniref:hypothetical protein n=1 Tax=Streptomyces sp. NPDC006208 TaxID=3156734 RepID=UPI0033AA06ED
MREPVRLVAANVVRWRRHGEDGRDLRPGTTSFQGGAKVYVIGDYGPGDDQDVAVIGHGRHTGASFTGVVPVRQPHSFRPRLVRSPECRGARILSTKAPMRPPAAAGVRRGA